MLRRPALLFLLFASSLVNPAVKDKPKFNSVGPIELTKEGERWAEKTLKKLSVEEKVGQLIMVRGLAEFQNVESPAYLNLRNDIRKFHIGSVLLTVRTDGAFLLRNQPYEAAMITNRLQRDSELPLLIGADFERGLSMRLLATPIFPHAMAFGAAGKPEYAERFGEVVARESRAIGVHWNFFPVADVNFNPLNPIINTRSFGEDPKQVSELVAAYIRGARADGLMTTVKHFPGHGDTDTDSHLSFARVGASLDRLEKVELPPFQAAIDAGVDSVMVAHVTVPALEPDPNKIATLSHKIITDLLINKMAFTGLVVTDAMDMRALTGIYKTDAQTTAGRAAVDALLAGNDMILLPSDLAGAYNGILAAVKSGEITSEMLDHRVRKVLQFKAAEGLNKARLVDIEAVAEEVGKPADMALAQEIADSAITLVRNDSPVLNLLAEEKHRVRGTSAAQPAYESAGSPDGSPSGTLALVLTEDVRSDWGRVFEREFLARVPDATVMFVDPRIATAMTEQVMHAVANSKVVVIAAYAVPSAGRTVKVQDKMQGSISLDSDLGTLCGKVIAAAAPKTALLSMGNPYLARDYPTTQTYICAFSHVPTSEIAAVKALFSEIPLRGKLPVTIPNIAERGTGLERSALAWHRSRRLLAMRPAKLQHGEGAVPK